MNFSDEKYDRIAGFAEYYNCAPANEDLTAGILATGIVVGGGYLIMKAYELCAKIVDMIASKAWNAYKNNPKVKARTEQRKANAAAKRDAKAQAKLQSTVVLGMPYPEYIEKMKAYEAKYGPTISRLHKQCNDAILKDLKYLTEKKEFKDFEVMYRAEKSEYADMWFDYMTAESYLKYADTNFSHLLVGQAIPFYMVKEYYLDDDAIGTSFYASENEKKQLKSKSHEVLMAYAKASNAIVEKHVDALVRELNKLGVKVEGWDYEHISDEFVYEDVLIDLVPPFKNAQSVKSGS
jgi:hypothetical protein